MKNSFFRAIVIVSFLFTGLLAGCECGELGPGAACTSHDDCGNYACDGLGEENTAETLYCATSCEKTEDCRNGAVCKDKKCQAESGGSKCSSDCKGYTCKDSKCLTECSGASDCASGYTCSSKKCVKKSTGVSCTKDSNCKNGEVCKDKKCTKDSTKPECTDDGGCVSGEVCRDNKCVAKTEPSCKSNTDCDAGEKCIDGKCKVDSSAECRFDVDCGNINTRHCNKGKCEYRTDGCSQGKPQCVFHCPKKTCWLECWRAGNGGEVKNSAEGNANKWREWPEGAEYCFIFNQAQPLCHKNPDFQNHASYVDGKKVPLIDCGQGAQYSWRQSSQGDGVSKKCNENKDLANASWQTLCQ